MKKADIENAKIDSLEGRNLCQSFGDLILVIEGSSALLCTPGMLEMNFTIKSSFAIIIVLILT